MTDTREIPLATGTLTISVKHAAWPIDDLCTFASRDNPRRAFLVVSKVLGRHIPVAPHLMRASFRDLAALIPTDLPGPVLVMGMAETAICLGQGVHEELLRATSRDDITYLHSTRQELDAPVLCRFEEPHSHASAHIVYAPSDMPSPRSLVIVDDEISTGTTISNLADALRGVFPGIERIIAVTLADWSQGRDWGAAKGIETVSLLSGSLHCDARPTLSPETAKASFDSAAVALGHMESHHNFGRLGRRDVTDEGDTYADDLNLPPASRIRVLATGEFTYPPFRLAEKLEAMGHDVVVQSTTRSPVQLSEAIKCRLTFADNYGTGIANFAYNLDVDDGRITLICHETPIGSIDPDLVAQLDARLICFAPPEPAQ